MERVNVDGLETDLKERLRTFANLAILNQIIIIFVRTQTLDGILNLLYIYMGHAKRFVTEIFSIAFITCFVLTG